MTYALGIIMVLAMLIAVGSGSRLETWDTSELDPNPQAVRQIRWPKRTIDVTLSTSLLSPGANIKPGSDVVGAVRRGLNRWSGIANVNFVVSWSATASISPADSGDGISLITIADTLENESFNADSTTARTRVFYDSANGEIAEADISINPRPKSDEGADLLFSTDGTPGTYDLEATVTHEIGHLLGLDHSAVLGATMQSHQAYNGTFGLPAFNERTLSEDDRQRVRSLYGSKLRLGKIEGRFADNRTPGLFVSLAGVTVWAESVATGKVVASGMTDEGGNYQLAGLQPGQYRVLVSDGPDSSSLPDTKRDQRRLRSFEVAQVAVKADASTSLNNNLVPQQSSSLTPQFIGLNGDLSTVALPLETGKRAKIYLAGEGIDQVPGTSISVTSPFFTVDPTTLTRESMATTFPVVSVEVTVAPNTPFGDYTIRLQSNSGEIAFVPGAITIDPGVGVPVSSPLDDAKFFAAQQFLDLTGKRPEESLLDKLLGQLNECGSNAECLRTKRLDIATELLLKEVPSNGVFLDSLYEAVLGRRIRLSEYDADRALLRGEASETNRKSFMLAFVRRAEFERKFPLKMQASEFVEALIAAISQNAKVDVAGQKESLVSLFDGSIAGRAAIVDHLISTQSVVDAQYNRAFVLTEYFSFLRREPDENGFKVWLTALTSKPLRDPAAARSMVCSFLNTQEYQDRFGMLPSHSIGDCN